MISKAALGLMSLGFVAMGGCFMDDGRIEATGTSESGNSDTAQSTSTTTGEGSSETLLTTTAPTTDGTTGDDTQTSTSMTDSSSSGPTSGTSDTQTSNATDDSTSSDTGFMCNDPFGDCNGNRDDECETNLDESTEHCGMCDNPCSGVCVGGLCQQSLFVFVTQNTFDGDLGNLDGADNICNESAASANLPGNYYAWLSTADSNPKARFEATGRPYVMPNNEMVALDWDDLTDGMLLTGISVDQHGLFVEVGLLCSSARAWSDTLASGELKDDNHCQNWTTASSNVYGHTGHPGMESSRWTNSNCSQQPCSEKMHLYCFQQ